MGWLCNCLYTTSSKSERDTKSGLCVKGWLQVNVVYMLGTFELYVAWELRMQDLVEYKDLGKTLAPWNP